MNPRSRRLEADLRLMKQRADEGRFTFESEGTLPERYQIEFKILGIALEGRKITPQKEHRCEAYLHREYPRRPPVVVWQTPIFHPNLLGPDRNGGVCIGMWKASESLADLMTRIADLVSYRSFSVGDALDTDAADWVSRSGLKPGFGLEEVIGIEVADQAAAVAIRPGAV